MEIIKQEKGSRDSGSGWNHNFKFIVQRMPQLKWHLSKNLKGCGYLKRSNWGRNHHRKGPRVGVWLGQSDLEVSKLGSGSHLGSDVTGLCWQMQGLYFYLVSGKPLESLEQRSTKTWIRFIKHHAGCCLRIASREEGYKWESSWHIL